MAVSSAIIDLRNLLAERFPQPLTPPNLRLATGLPAIDTLLGGGLPKSAITEGGKAGKVFHCFSCGQVRKQV